MPIIFLKATFESNKEKFLSRVKRNEVTGCLEWLGGMCSTGYGQFSWGGANGGPITTTAHRAAWWLFKGQVPEGMVLCHKCNNRKCVETDIPGHLYLGTQKRNMLDRIESGAVPAKYKNFDWKESDRLEKDILREMNADKTIEQVCVSLGIGRTTFYRLRNHYQSIRDLIEKNKRWHRQRGSRNSSNAKFNDAMYEKAKIEIAAGGNMREISKRIGINVITLRKWADRIPELAELLANRKMTSHSGRGG